MLFQKTRLDDSDDKNRLRIFQMAENEKNERNCTRNREVDLLFPPINISKQMSSGKVSLCISFFRRASLAVETALVLPLFFLGMVTLISFMDIYKVQTEHLLALCEKTKEAGMYAYVLDGSGPEEVTLPDIYSYTPVGGLVPLPKVRMFNVVKVHAWTGAEQGLFQDGSQEEPEAMVYMTESGSVYHKSPGCRYLNVSLDQVSGSRVSSMRNANGERYAACETCSRGSKPAGSVYITKNGNRYHNLSSCSGLKRTVRLVKESETGGMRACSRCG